MMTTKNWDHYTFYNHLIYEGILKEVNLKNAGDFYLSDCFKKFKDSFYGKILHNKLSMKALGLCKIGSSEIFLIEITDESSNKGVIDLNGNTFIPVIYKSLTGINIGENNVLFIAEKENNLFSLYANNECIVEDASAIIPCYSAFFDYEAKDKNSFMRDVEYSIQQQQKCHEILIRKKLPFDDKIKKIIADTDLTRTEIECVYDEETKYSLAETTKYFAALALKNNEQTVNTCVVLKTEMFKDSNSAIIDSFKIDNGIVHGFFYNVIFMEVE